MNNRDYKQFAQGSVYHIYNRGVGKMNIFLDEEDFLFFLKRLCQAIFPEDQKSTAMAMVPIATTIKERNRKSKLPQDSFDLLLYCLMPNHFHLVVQQKMDVPVSALMLKVCTSYSKYFNKKYDRVGSLYQDQFKAVLVESNEQLLWLTSYIHNNPLKAKLVSDLNEYIYSSHLDYIGLRKGTLCKKDLILGQCKSKQDYLNLISKFDGSFLSEELKID